MNLSKKLYATLVAGVLFTAPLSKAGFTPPKTFAEGIELVTSYAPEFARPDLKAKTTLPGHDFGFINIENARPQSNLNIIRIAVILAMAGTVISEQNSPAEVVSSGIFSALGTGFALGQLKTQAMRSEGGDSLPFEETGPSNKALLIALIAYLLGQNGNHACAYLKDCFYSKNPLRATVDLLTTRPSLRAMIGAAVRVVGPLAAMYTKTGQEAVSGNIQYFFPNGLKIGEKVVFSPATVKSVA